MKTAAAEAVLHVWVKAAATAKRKSDKTRDKMRKQEKMRVFLFIYTEISY